MKVTGNKGAFKVSAEKGARIYSFSDYITNGALLVAKKRVKNLGDLSLEEISNTALEKTIKDFAERSLYDIGAVKQLGSYIEVKSGKTDKKRSYVKLDINSVIQYVSLDYFEILASDDFLLYSEKPLSPIYFAKKVATYPNGVRVNVIELVGLLMPITGNSFRPKI
jgi:hypothetical protein